jgi:hypothetical protein
MKSMLILFISTVGLFANMTLSKITQKQLSVLQKVRDVAKSIPDNHGHTHEDILSAICLIESEAGLHKGNLNSSSLGVMQINLSTARRLEDKIEKLQTLERFTDAQLARKLLRDTTLSAKVASCYLAYLYNERGGSTFHAISGYNGGMRNSRYYHKVLKTKKLVEQLVAIGKLT